MQIFSSSSLFTIHMLLWLLLSDKKFKKNQSSFVSFVGKHLLRSYLVPVGEHRIFIVFGLQNREAAVD
jgi:hypothetical protein